MIAQHTPGPWFAEPMVGETDVIWIGNADGYVAQITREDGLEAGDLVDACLIAAAPDLLAALETIANSEEYNGDSFVCDFQTLQSVARAALRKAGVL